jgi:multisubunit Na+/H+ antiporter MnhG subunit
MIMYCCFGVVSYINMCICHAKIWFIEEKTKNPVVTIFTALTGPVTALTIGIPKKPFELRF